MSTTSFEGSCQGYVSGFVKFGLGCPSRGRVRDILCACEQQEGTIPSMFAVGIVDYIVDISYTDRIAREHFRFLEHRF